MRELLDGVARQQLAERNGITLEQAGAQLEAERAAAARRPLAELDADWRAMMTALEAEVEAHETRILAGDYR